MPKTKTKKTKKSQEKDSQIPAKFKKIVAEIEKMSVVDLAELVKILEGKFGVSATAPVAAAPTAGVGEDSGKAEEEKSEFTVHLKSVGEQKINVIKAVKEITQKGLKEAKDLVDQAPSDLAENVKKEEAEEMKKKLEDAGATVELK